MEAVKSKRGGVRAEHRRAEARLRASEAEARRQKDDAPPDPKSTTPFESGCQECDSRALASDPRFHASGLTGSLSVEYLAALRAVFGPHWQAGHERVKDWAKRIKQSKGEK